MWIVNGYDDGLSAFSKQNDVAEFEFSYCSVGDDNNLVNW